MDNVITARRGVPTVRSRMQQLERRNRQLWWHIFISDCIIAAFVVWFGLWITGVLPK